MIFVILILAVFFALNMGGASFAAAFATAYGGKVVSRQKGNILFLIFVILGAVTLGEKVSVTLGQNLVPSNLVEPKALIVIFFCAGLSMFISNMMHIPQSTSLVTVAAIAGVGAYYQQLNLTLIYFFLPFWILLPILSYVLTHMATGYIYPPNKKNFWVYEKFVNRESALRKFVLVSACYSAFSVGTNNVANVAGPFLGIESFPFLFILLSFAGIYGMGGLIFTGPLNTAGNKIVPLGLLTASIISIVSGSLMIGASVFGIPQSFVMLQLGAIFAVSSLKEGHRVTFKSPTTVKTLYTWTINPIITFFISFGLCFLIIKGY